MPTHAPDSVISSHHLEITQTNVACPAPLTPPPEVHDENDLENPFPFSRTLGGDEVSLQSVRGRIAAVTTQAQDGTTIPSSAAIEEKTYADRTDTFMFDRDDVGEVAADERMMISDESQAECLGPSAPAIMADEVLAGVSSEEHGVVLPRESVEATAARPQTLSSPMIPTGESRTRGFGGTGTSPVIPSIDQELDWSGHLKEWDFSRRRLRPQYPSATFQPYSKFKGTQQSDRQIYNVEVTILTVDIEQCSMSGYLQICGLTPDHPTLTTFFTGEIIGGPDPKYSFRTRDPAWGASDKTDLTHWARFPAWRPLSLHAKRNINFVYPMNHENWWQQEHIFMRWKEHFLVPDYKLKSIQGASFEGFYYICFNQIEGRVSGIYFHSKSEKYQQLELKHEGKQGVWGMGVCPSIEFR